MNLRLDRVYIPPVDGCATTSSKLSILLARCDLLHPGYGGNKWYKLAGHQHRTQASIDAKSAGRNYRIIAPGGAYSNLVAALSQYAKELELVVDFIIRGEPVEDKRLSPVLRTAKHLGHRLHYLARSEYQKFNENDRLAQSTYHQKKQDLLSLCRNLDGFTLCLQDLALEDVTLVPEGAGGVFGATGVMDLYKDILLAAAQENKTLTSIFHAAGTGSSAAGLWAASSLDTGADIAVHAISVLRPSSLDMGVTRKLAKQALCNTLEKGAEHRKQDRLSANKFSALNNRLFCHDTYDFSHGGFAKRSPALERFSQAFEQENSIAIDHVYMAKLLYGMRVLHDTHVVGLDETMVAVHSGLSPQYPWE